jgi:hypothetical protein
MTTNIITVLLLAALGLAIETTIVNDPSITGSITICSMSDPSGGSVPQPPQQ